MEIFYDPMLDIYVNSGDPIVEAFIGIGPPMLSISAVIKKHGRPARWREGTDGERTVQIAGGQLTPYSHISISYALVCARSAYIYSLAAL